MGLEIYYDLHAPAHWTAAQVRTALEAARERALEQGFAEVDEFTENAPTTLSLKDPPDEGPFLHTTSSIGWQFRTWPGEGCETAFFGLSWFPAAFVAHDGRTVESGWGEGWHYHTGCKTQYADCVSREHFLRCHCGVVAVLDACREAGLETNVRDVSEYWQHRDLAKLHGEIDSWNRTVAAFAGAFKDAMEGAPGDVVAPIFAKSDFEHLEAEGQAESPAARGAHNPDSA